MKQHLKKVSGYNIRFVEEGDTQNGTLLLLHGLGASSERWLRVIGMFAKQFRVIAPDIIGFGYSEKPDVNYSIPFFVDFVKDFIRALRLEHVNLIGASLGGHIAAELAAVEPEAVENLVLVTPAGMMKKPTAALERYMAAALYPSLRNAMEAFEQMAVDPAAVDEIYVKDFINRMSLPNAKYAFLSALMGSKMAPDLADRLRNIRARTLVVWGKNDKVIPVQYAKKFQAAIPNSKLAVIENCGHTPYVEQPSAFAGTVIDFLAGAKH